MSHLFFYFVIISAVFAAGINAQGGIRCNENEVWSQCSKNCESICPGTPKACILSCAPGCICIPGYSRTDRKGTCVPTSECPQAQ
ncbi:chymotrypsin-elastase inhibitor ixodidin-like [Aphidius gifuensis]|uniref:chymotrypsin-elastase inhibitor ixodidin-like n=1 Tax=Aphidius gifuensis TaxID=684658 RepID=UPI001CDCC43A|nr:chymotrypsin-elastase inhibitor ixodidin-like [Aphidius gifuensis]